MCDTHLLRTRLRSHLLQPPPLLSPSLRDLRQLLFRLFFYIRSRERELDDLLVRAQLEGVFELAEERGVVGREFAEVLEEPLGVS